MDFLNHAASYKIETAYEVMFVAPYQDDYYVEEFLQAPHLELELNFGEFIETPFFTAGYEFVVDSVAAIMIFTITLISFVVHLYSTVYMRNDPHSVRFFGFLSLFTFFMVVLVTGANFVMLYIGWEGVGLSSFLLIAF